MIIKILTIYVANEPFFEKPYKKKLKSKFKFSYSFYIYLDR